MQNQGLSASCGGGGSGSAGGQPCVGGCCGGCGGGVVSSGGSVVGVAIPGSSTSNPGGGWSGAPFAQSGYIAMSIDGSRRPCGISDTGMSDTSGIRSYGGGCNENFDGTGGGCYALHSTTNVSMPPPPPPTSSSAAVQNGVDSRRAGAAMQPTSTRRGISLFGYTCGSVCGGVAEGPAKPCGPCGDGGIVVAGDGSYGAPIPRGSCGGWGYGNPGGDCCGSGGNGFVGDGVFISNGGCVGCTGNFNGTGCGCMGANIVAGPSAPMPASHPAPIAVGSTPPPVSNVNDTPYPWLAPYSCPKFTSSETIEGVVGTVQNQPTTPFTPPRVGARSFQPADWNDLQTVFGHTMGDLKQMTLADLFPLFKKHATNATTIGGLLHESEKCTPCIMWFQNYCTKSLKCTYCHMPHIGLKKKRIRRCKKTRAILKGISTTRDEDGSDLDQIGAEKDFDTESVALIQAGTFREGREARTDCGAENRSTKQSL
eukprot:TRINITY_DN56838_c0_g1_i1.p1 TRINITY_DN56838_c0_g1~~TRINITY_DN56838_c0_g1_i1.p1  ORF type:complete len:502 (+),score=51.26 TRINITY_DN56838_c0_g1_i1:63-1508(+)